MVRIKFGLKPVAFNHIMVYQRKQVSGPQVLVISKQIYANHCYFDSSLALTAFVKVPGANPGSFLFYENRSRADGLGGAFSKFKRGIIEDKAVNSLKTILESSKANFSRIASQGTESPLPAAKGRRWSRLTFGRVQVAALLLITAFIALLAFGSYNWKTGNQRSGSLTRNLSKEEV